jgi:hypothetical protein
VSAIRRFAHSSSARPIPNGFEPELAQVQISLLQSLVRLAIHVRRSPAVGGVHSPSRVTHTLRSSRGLSAMVRRYGIPLATA